MFIEKDFYPEAKAVSCSPWAWHCVGHTAALSKHLQGWRPSPTRNPVYFPAIPPCVPHPADLSVATPPRRPPTIVIRNLLTHLETPAACVTTACWSYPELPPRSPWLPRCLGSHSNQNTWSCRH